MRLVPTRSVRSHRPFQGQGANLYVGSGTPDPGPTSVLFRRNRLAASAFLAGPESGIGGDNTQKTARVATVVNPTVSIPYAIPAGLANQTVYLQVRTYKDDVENESNARPVRLDLDGSLANVTGIHGTATLLGHEKRDGGIVRLRFGWRPAATGIQPTLFRAQRTAGPTSPADATVATVAGQFVYEIDTPALSDSAAYTFKIRAENGATVKDILTGIVVSADATGPPAPTSGSALPW